MDVPVLANQQELIYISSVWTQDVIWKTYWERCMIGMDEERFWFLCFNGISTFVGYLMPKPSF